ncbi:class I SAM-dependent methyltransferase [Aurantiacibacter poecillastricola]|uniref:class I SAM-dependent methyltransferase n=1 Tax=Aurantiacibacter poecillastricola TaxID=3064385 RepID=UPI00273FF548|nr:class I SAM-dependent methyltransferase [Aurantiacibacter sp. 219JJ12-13]MDP5261460.1 class I SAM-dependent methyltransferase [Aurantiacibacter sp. 219JJ12-13]
MPYTVTQTTGFDSVIARLNDATGHYAASYIADHKQRCIDDARRLAREFPGARILNVGGTPYLFEYIARELGLDVVTVDLDPSRDPQQLADLGINVQQVDIETPEGRSAVDFQSYDVVVMAEILEHMRIDLVATLRGIAESLRADARIYLTTPNFYYAPSFARMLAEGRSGPPLVKEWRKIGEVGHMGHVREYTRRELEELFAFCGLVVESLTVRNCREVDVRGGGAAQYPLRLLANALARRFDRFGQELVYLLRPAAEQTR